MKICFSICTRLHDGHKDVKTIIKLKLITLCLTTVGHMKTFITAGNGSTDVQQHVLSNRIYLSLLCLIISILFCMLKLFGFKRTFDMQCF